MTLYSVSVLGRIGVDRRPCSDSRHVTAPYKLALYYYYYYWYRWRPIVLGTIGYASWYRSNPNIWVNGKMQICGYDAEVGLGLGNLHMVITSTYPHLCILPPAINMAVLKSSLIFCTQS